MVFVRRSDSEFLAVQYETIVSGQLHRRIVSSSGRSRTSLGRPAEEFWAGRTLFTVNGNPIPRNVYIASIPSGHVLQSLQM